MILSQQDVYNLFQKTGKDLQKMYPKYQAIPLAEWVKVCVAVAKIESKFNTSAKNKSSTATGMMQILKPTKKEIETKILKVIPTTTQTALLDAGYSAKLGMAYIGYFYLNPNKGNKNWKRTIISYNQGHYDESSASLSYYNKFANTFNDIDYASLETGYNDYSSLPFFQRFLKTVADSTNFQPEFTTT
jgi:hypothetical protein